MIGTKGVGKVLGGNGGKFQERTSSPREGVAHWRGASTAIFPLSSPLQLSNHHLLTYATQADLPACLFYAIKRSVAYQWVVDDQSFQLVINIFLVGAQPPASCL